MNTYLMVAILPFFFIISFYFIVFIAFIHYVYYVRENDEYHTPHHHHHHHCKDDYDCNIYNGLIKMDKKHKLFMTYLPNKAPEYPIGSNYDNNHYSYI